MNADNGSSFDIIYLPFSCYLHLINNIQLGYGLNLIYFQFIPNLDVSNLFNATLQPYFTHKPKCRQMINFNELTQEQRENILSNHITTELLVDRATLNFDNIETDLNGTNLTSPFEVPPIIIDNKHLAQILTYSSDSKGRWIRTMVRTYLEGGRVFYKLHNQDTFIATLTFPQ